MTETVWDEPLVETHVTYTLLLDGKVYVVENVPARVNTQTGERLFAPETVRRLQQIIRGNESPARTMETKVFAFGG